jgi:hypothetical protein
MVDSSGREWILDEPLCGSEFLCGDGKGRPAEVDIFVSPYAGVRSVCKALAAIKRHCRITAPFTFVPHDAVIFFRLPALDDARSFLAGLAKK